MGGFRNTAWLKVDFGSRGHSRVPDFYLESILFDFKSEKPDLNSTLAVVTLPQTIDRNPDSMLLPELRIHNYTSI